MPVEVDGIDLLLQDEACDGLLLRILGILRDLLRDLHGPAVVVEVVVDGEVRLVEHGLDADHLDHAAEARDLGLQLALGDQRVERQRRERE